MELTKEQEIDISAILDRCLTSAEKGNIDFLSKFSNTDIEEIKKLAKTNGVYAVRYMRFRLKEKIPLDAVIHHYNKIVEKDKRFQTI